MPRCWASLPCRLCRLLQVGGSASCSFLLFTPEVYLSGRSHGTAWNTGVEGWYCASTTSGEIYLRSGCPQIRAPSRPVLIMPVCPVFGSWPIQLLG